MAAKFVAICAFACAIQGLNAALLPRPQAATTTGFHTYPEALRYFQGVEKEYGGIVENFEQMVESQAEDSEIEYGEYFGDLMTGFDDLAIENSVQPEGNADMEVVRACIREQQPNFQKLADLIRQRVTDARVVLRQFIVQTIGPYVERAREAFRILAQTVAEFPAKIRQCIEERDFTKALQVIRDTRDTVRKSAMIIVENMKDARQKLPQIKEKARELRMQIEMEVRAAMEVIREAIRQCIANGGPKAPIVPAVPVVPVAPVAPVSGAVVAPAEPVSNLLAPADAVVSEN